MTKEKIKNNIEKYILKEIGEISEIGEIRVKINRFQ